MKEDLLHFLWKLQLFQPAHLRTINDEKITVLKPGLENKNQGPDFLNARIDIEGKLWVGHVEIHVKSSDWFVHLHQLDENYNATILHVVWEYNVPIFSPAHVEIPALELKTFVATNVLQQYESLFKKPFKWIYCEKLIASVAPFKIEKWFERLYFERMQDKIAGLRLYKTMTKNNWEALLFLSLAKNFGLKINGTNFLDIAQNIPFEVFRRTWHSEIQVEAILMGSAGLLKKDHETIGSYYKTLKQEFEFLKVKFKLKEPLVQHVHFFRLRPANFPTIRLSQLGQLYYRNHSLFRSLMEATTLEELYAIFDIKAAEFWDNHYTFEKASKRKYSKRISKKFINLILINTILPLKFLYKENEEHWELLRAIPSELNTIISNFSSLGITAKNAFESQALIQLKTKYCEQGKCLQCAIGNEILKNQS